jgi:hypothetical protein
MQVTKKVTSPLPTTDNIFYAGTGMLLCRSEEKVGGCGACWGLRGKECVVVMGVSAGPDRQRGEEWHGL